MTTDPTQGAASEPQTPEDASGEAYVDAGQARRVQRLTGARLALQVFLVLGAVLAIAGFAVLEGEVRTLTKHLNDLRAQAATMAAAVPVMAMTITDAQSVMGEADADIERACQLAKQLKQTPGNAGYLTLTWNICPNTPGSVAPELAKFQDVYFRAVSARLGQDEASAASLYQQALDIAATPPPRTPNQTGPSATIPVEWVVRAREGLAYAELKTKHYTEARRDALLAQSLMPAGQRFVFADTTGLKALCSIKPVDASAVRTELAKIRSEFDTMTATNDSYRKCYAQLDRGTLEGDDELYLDCAGTGIAPMAVSAPRSCPTSPDVAPVDG